MNLRTALNKSNREISINELFSCCGKKNQLTNTINKPTAVINKYFLIHFFLLLMKNAAIVCVGQAQSKL